MQFLKIFFAYRDRALDSRAPGICKKIEGVSYYGCVTTIHLSVSDAWACGNNVGAKKSLTTGSVPCCQWLYSFR